MSCPIAKKLAKVGSQFCSILNKLSKNWQFFSKFGHAGTPVQKLIYKKAFLYRSIPISTVLYPAEREKSLNRSFNCAKILPLRYVITN